MRVNFILFLLVFSICDVLAQDKYWIYFADKDVSDSIHLSPLSYQNRKLQGLPLYQDSDLPVAQTYQDSLRAYGVSVIHRSRWLNAVTSLLTREQVRTISGISFVKQVTPVNRGIIVSGSYDYAAHLDPHALKQIHAEVLEDKGLTGKKVKIGIIDGSFYNANTNVTLKTIMKDHRVLATRDFVGPGRSMFYGSTHSNKDIIDDHGTAVFQMIAGNDRKNKTRYGAAIDAQFYLARTDDTEREFRGEEDYWVSALEWLDSLGVRLVNTSLGYSTDFDDPGQNYTREDMNGNRTVITRAAQMAAVEKGMIIVVSAGNDGENEAWKIISAPADAKSVVAVGATDKYWLKPDYSGVGPEFLPYLKPNISCYTPGGTSFSAPVITGLIACLLQKYPTLSSERVIDVLSKSGHLYPFGNNYLGNGVPDVRRVLAMLRGDDVDQEKREKVSVQGHEFLIQNYSQDDAYVILFHKRDSWQVERQETILPEGSPLKIVKPSDAVLYTTVVFKDKIIEISWKQ